MATFNDLPAEIRNIMYEKLLMSESHSQYRNPHELALFTVSKQLHFESSSYFYQHNNIAVDAYSSKTDAATILPPVADRYLRFMKSLTMHVLVSRPNTTSTHKAAAAIAGLSVLGARFDELHLVISSRLSHIVNSRVDDSIMDSSHPITSAIKTLLQSRTTKVLRVRLDNAWFAMGVARALQCSFGSQLEFYRNGNSVPNISILERPLIGRYTSTHLTALGLDDNVTKSWMTDCSSSPLTPASLPSSLCSAFADLDTFSISSFELGSDDEGDLPSHSDSFKNDFDMEVQPFFTEDDIEEWSASTQPIEEPQNCQDLGEGDDIGEDDDIQDVPQHDIDAIIHNIRESAHHVANEHDVNYMTNFAPELLLSRHHLGYLAGV